MEQKVDFNKYTEVIKIDLKYQKPDISSFINKKN